MIRIRCNKTILSVPRSAYEKIYKPAGWEVVSQNKKKLVETEGSDSSASRTPLESELSALDSVEELKTFAEKQGISVEGLTSRKAIRAAIREALNQQINE